MVSLILYLIALAALTFAMFLMPRRVFALWRGTRAMPQSPPLGWPGGRASWQGWVRATPVMGSICGLGMLIAAWCFLLLTSIHNVPLIGDPAWRTRLIAGVLTGVALVLIGIVLGFSVILFNRPRFLVAPSLRNERGALVEQLGRRRSN
jgi:hypothetical protein